MFDFIAWHYGAKSIKCSELFKRTIKYLYWKIFSKVFNKVQNIHAITNMEAKNLRSIFKNSNIAIIPNSMMINESLIESNKRL